MVSAFVGLVHNRLEKVASDLVRSLTISDMFAA